jgi:hypothetical protein
MKFIEIFYISGTMKKTIILATIKKFLNIETQQKLTELEKVNMIIKETMSNCNTIIKEFRETKKINTLINCKNDDIFTEKYKSDLFMDIMMTLSMKKSDLESNIDKINEDIKKLENPKLRNSLIEMKDEKQKKIINELSLLKGSFLEKILDFTGPSMISLIHFWRRIQKKKLKLITLNVVMNTRTF